MADIFICNYGVSLNGHVLYRIETKLQSEPMQKVPDQDPLSNSCSIDSLLEDRTFFMVRLRYKRPTLNHIYFYFMLYTTLKCARQDED